MKPVRMTKQEAINYPSKGCIGSIQWGIDTGRAYDVKGLWKYGRTITDADSHEHAVTIALSWDCTWDDETFTFLAPPVLEVWRIGPTFTYMLSDLHAFTVRNGRPVPVVSRG